MLKTFDEVVLKGSHSFKPPAFLSTGSPSGLLKSMLYEGSLAGLFL
jgi:hypothetical protein